MSSKLEHLLIKAVAADLVHFANRKAEAQGIFLMQVLQQLAVYTVLDGVHHLSLSHDGSPLLLYPSGQEFSFKCHLSQDIQNLCTMQAM